MLQAGIWSLGFLCCSTKMTAAFSFLGKLLWTLASCPRSPQVGEAWVPPLEATRVVSEACCLDFTAKPQQSTVLVSGLL